VTELVSRIEEVRYSRHDGSEDARLNDRSEYHGYEEDLLMYEEGSSWRRRDRKRREKV